MVWAWEKASGHGVDTALLWSAGEAIWNGELHSETPVAVAEGATSGEGTTGVGATHLHVGCALHRRTVAALGVRVLVEVTPTAPHFWPLSCLDFLGRTG